MNWTPPKNLFWKIEPRGCNNVDTVLFAFAQQFVQKHWVLEPLPEIAWVQLLHNEVWWMEGRKDRKLIWNSYSDVENLRPCVYQHAAQVCQSTLSILSTKTHLNLSPSIVLCTSFSVIRAHLQLELQLLYFSLFMHRSIEN